MSTWSSLRRRRHLPGQPSVRVAPALSATSSRGAPARHFDGVLTVVLKLLHLTEPDVAFFGDKDYQQLVLIRRMVADLDVPCEIVGVPTVREPDGLALSVATATCRAERAPPRCRSSALRAGADAAAEGAGAARAAPLSCARGRADAWTRLPGAHRPRDARRPGTARPAVRRSSLVAARVGSTRLIDNDPVMLRRRQKADRCSAPCSRQDPPGHGDPGRPALRRSVTVDQDLLDAADLLPGEKVAMWT